MSTLWGGWLLLGCTGSPNAGDPATPERPQNLVVLLADTLRADHLGAWGYERDTTPVLDGFAREGLRFAHHHTHSSRTGPSVATLFTGRYPRSHGVVNPLDAFDAKGTLAEDQLTLAEILSSRGWQTGGVVTNRNVSTRFGFGQGFGTFLESEAIPAERVVSAATDFLDQVGQQSFFLYLHFMDTHSPYEGQSGGFVDPGYSGPVTGAHAELDAILRGNYTLTEADLTQLVALYDQSLRSLDTAIGGFLGDLDRRGLSENTTVVFLSDHGEELMDHGGLLHGYTVFEEQLHVPLLIRSPGVEPGVVDRVTRQVDVLPTLLALLGVEESLPLQGQSLLQKPSEPDTPIYASTQIRALWTARARSYSVGGWKLVKTDLPQPGQALYHLAEDPGEQVDRSVAEPERIRVLGEAMDALFQQWPVGPGARVQLDPEEIEALRALGYVE